MSAWLFPFGDNPSSCYFKSPLALFRHTFSTNTICFSSSHKSVERLSPSAYCWTLWWDKGSLALAFIGQNLYHLQTTRKDFSKKSVRYTPFLSPFLTTLDRQSWSGRNGGQPPYRGSSQWWPKHPVANPGHSAGSGTHNYPTRITRNVSIVRLDHRKPVDQVLQQRWVDLIDEICNIELEGDAANRPANPLEH